MMTERERNKRLMILMNKLLWEKDDKSIELIESMVQNDNESMKKSFEIISRKSPFHKDITKKVKKK